MAVYGNRDYEDALLELNDIAADRGFHVVASCACIAQHSIASEVGKGRPDENDSAWIRDFAKRVEKKIESGEDDEFTVPGNHPYRDGSGKSVAPISLPACGMCGACAEACPVNAISFEADTVVTDPEKCIQIRRENEAFL